MFRLGSGSEINSGGYGYIVNKKKKKKQSYFATVPPQEILPIVDGRYESTVDGLFVIGDVTGLPLVKVAANQGRDCLLYTSPSPRDATLSRMPSSA